MPAIPLALNAYKRATAFLPEVRCVNMYVEKDESGVSPDGTLRIQRPGLTLAYQLDGSVRGMRYWPSKVAYLTAAVGGLYLGQARIGPGGVGGASIAVTLLAACIVSDGAITLTDGATVTNVANPEGQTPVDVDQLAGYFVILMASGRFYWIEPGASTIGPLAFANAESSGDGGRAIRRVGDELFVFGSETAEVLQRTGDAALPFAPAAGRTLQRGCLDADTVRRFDNALVWVGDDGTVYRLGAVPQAISGPGLDERLRRRAGPMSAWVYKYDGHEFYALRIPGEGVFAYDASTQAWCEVTWPLTHGETVDGVTLAGDAQGRISRLYDAATDFGRPFERIVTGTVSVIGRAGRNDSLSVGIGSSADCTLRVRWRDGQDDYPAYADELDVRAPMDVATMYRLGQPEQPQRTFELSCVDPVTIRIAGAKVNEGWQ